MKLTKIFSALFAAIIIINTFSCVVFANDSAFELIRTDESNTLGGTIYYYKHKTTGAEVVYNNNNSDRLQFAIGFKTPPTDSKGANHVLEHALLCGSEKYPTKNIMNYINNGTSSLLLNGVTSDDFTYYLINTKNQTEYFNMIDVYMNGIFHPLFLTDKNIFRQQGVRLEYANGKAQYNGVVYNELRIKNLNTDENSLSFIANKLYKSIYGDTTPSFSASGELDAIKELTYEDLLKVYSTYYIPSNSMTYLAGNIDIDKVFDVLDAFFSENDTKAPDISFADTKQIPLEPISEYNIDENTKTVDIGFMTSGVPASAGAQERYARDILFNIIYEKMKTETNCTEMYTVSGNSGGISTLAMILSEIPVEKKEEIISAYSKVLRDLSENSIDELEIDTYIEQQQKYFYANWENVFKGLLYHNNPVVYTEINSVCDYLKNNKEYFDQILKKYFTENPYKTVIVSGNGLFGSEDNNVNVSAEELEKINHETEAFQKWNDAADTPEVIDRIPFLTLDEVKDVPEKVEPIQEVQDGISFYYTEKGSNSVSMYFPLDIKGEDFDYVQLMHYFLESQAKKAGLSFYTMLTPLENSKKQQGINPQLLVGFYGDNTAENLKNIVAFLQAEETWDENYLAEYIRTAPAKILESYNDPYFLSTEMKNSALSASDRFSYLFPQNTIVKGSSHYYHFLQSLDPNDALEITKRIKDLANDIVLNSKPVVGYIGKNGDFEDFKNTVSELFADANENESANLKLPIGRYSAATITELEDANHFMLAASYDNSEYSGKLEVLAKVLSAKYVTPTMSGKHGAYGASIGFYNSSMTSAVSGLADVDLAIEVWQGMGDYLRNMQMTQKELDAFIVSAVKEYDEYDYKASEYGAQFALTGKSSGECDMIRNEMLATTVADIKGYADFIDNLVGQMRIFAVLGKSAADSSKFDFAYYADADTLTVIPRFMKNSPAYIQGKTEKEFAPDEYITRAEVAAIIDRIIADQRDAQAPSMFNDVKQDDWYYNAVVSLAEKGIITGYETGDFKPGEYISRAELSAILSKFIYDKAAESNITYSDISSNEWYYECVSTMIDKGYINGYDDNTIRPNQPVTRAETVAIINRMLGLSAPANSENSFVDVDTAHWAYSEIMAASK